MRKLFANVRDTAVAGFFFLLPAYVVIIVATKAWTALSSLGSKVAAMFGMKSMMGMGASTVSSGLLLILIWIAFGVLARLSLIPRLNNTIERWVSAVIPGYETYKRIAEEKSRNETKPLPYTSALIQVEGYWQPGYIVDQDSLDNYSDFLPNSPEANEGRVLIARKNQIRIISSITANQLNASLERMGKGLLSDFESVKIVTL